MEVADGTPLKKSLARSLRKEKLRALALIAPLLIFVLVTFVLPIGTMLTRSIDNSIVEEILPRTVLALEDWNEKGDELPNEMVFRSFVEDFQDAIADKNHTKIGSRLNYEVSGMSSLFRKSARKVEKWDLTDNAPIKQKLIEVNKAWGDVET